MSSTKSSPKKSEDDLKDTEEAIQGMTLEDTAKPKGKSGSLKNTSKDSGTNSAGGGGSGCGGGLKVLKKNQKGKCPKLSPSKGKPSSSAGASGVSGSGSGNLLVPQNADSSLIFSGHQELNTLFASNDTVTAPITVNVCNAPNNSTVQCGCENINCPFCNLMMSIEKTDPSVLQ